MWRPDAVVSRHKRRAVVLWVLLILCIIAYACYLVYDAFDTASNPDTSLMISNNVYRYPDISMCMYEGNGCDQREKEEECVSSANYTEGGSVKAVYHPGDESEQEIISYYTRTASRGWCVVFKTSDVDIDVGSTRDAHDFLDYVSLELYWYPGGSANQSTTCITETGKWKDHSESIVGYLNDTETGTVSTEVQVSYTCMTPESTSYVTTYLGIGLTQVSKLGSDEDINSYKAKTTSSATYKVERSANITGIESPYAYVAMKVAQQPDSLEEITELNPFAIAELLGYVGGFWDLLLVFWPIFFVASTRQAPLFKFRNFQETLTKARDGASSVTSKPSSRALTRGPSRSVVEEEIPAWDGASQGAQESEVLIRLFDEHRLVAVVNSGCIKNFLKSKFNATSLKYGAPEPVLKKLLPVNTYLIVVPPGSTTMSIAKAVAGYCKLGGDNINTFDTGPIAVKAKLAQCSVVQAQALSASEYVGTNDEIGDEPDVDLGVGEQYAVASAMPRARSGAIV